MSVMDKDNQPLGDKAALERHIQLALDTPEPSGLQLEIAYRAVRTLFNPVVMGEENLPDKPCLFVGNHSLFALDGWVLGPVFLRELNRFPRGMGDRFLVQAHGIDFQFTISREHFIHTATETRRGQITGRGCNPDRYQPLHQALCVAQFLDRFTAQLAGQCLVAPHAGEYALRQVLLHRTHLMRERA